jgi:hypothetical protein
MRTKNGGKRSYGVRMVLVCGVLLGLSGLTGCEALSAKFKSEKQDARSGIIPRPHGFSFGGVPLPLD